MLISLSIHTEGKSCFDTSSSACSQRPSCKGWDSSLPAVYFLYDLSPITVEISDAPKSLGHFLTRVCAVVGGVFAVTGMLDRWIHRAVNLINKAE